MGEKIPILYEKNFLCSGCGACFAICPHNAIKMKSDSEGFFYPYIEKDKCISCYKCVKVCKFKESEC